MTAVSPVFSNARSAGCRRRRLSRISRAAWGKIAQLPCGQLWAARGIICVSASHDDAPGDLPKALPVCFGSSVSRRVHDRNLTIKAAHGIPTKVMYVV